MAELVIKNGKVVFEDKEAIADIVIDNGLIVEILTENTIEGYKDTAIIDATGKYVLPGVVNPHMHCNLIIRDIPTATFRDSSIAAAYGGVTTIIDFAKQEPGSFLIDSIERRRNQAEPNMAVDYALHLMLLDGSFDTFEQLSKVFDYGVTSCKGFMTTSSEGPALDDGSLFHLFNIAGKLQMVVMLHAENQSLIERFTRDYIYQGKTELRYFADSHPAITESEAVNRALFLAKGTSCPIYFCHVSTAEAVQMIADAYRNGARAWAETCPHYLLFNSTVYRGDFDQAMKFIRFPSIKDETNNKGLWAGISKGGIASIGTDDVALHLKEKARLAQNQPFNKLPGGMAQVELELPLMFSEAVVKRGIGLKDIVSLLSTNPAKIFGLYPKKGVIKVGADADLVIFNPNQKWIVDPEKLHMGTGYSIYDGWEVTGKVEKTILRGNLIVDHEDYIGKHQGKFLKRVFRERFGDPK